MLFFFGGEGDRVRFSGGEEGLGLFCGFRSIDGCDGHLRFVEELFDSAGDVVSTGRADTLMNVGGEALWVVLCWWTLGEEGRWRFLQGLEVEERCRCLVDGNLVGSVGIRECQSPGPGV